MRQAKWMARLLGLAIVVMCLDASAAGDEVGEGETKAESQGAKYLSAASIDFRSALGLHFNALASLGARIEQARQNADPAGLAIAAKELEVAEALAPGAQKAAITAHQLMAESERLAQQRDISNELKAVAMLTGDEAARTNLMKLARQAESREKEAAAAAEEGAKPRGIWHELIVNNRSHEHIHVYYNGRELGHLEPHEHGHFFVGDHAHDGHFDLHARGSIHSWDTHVHGDHRDFEWSLVD